MRSLNRAEDNEESGCRRVNEEQQTGVKPADMIKVTGDI